MAGFSPLLGNAAWHRSLSNLMEAFRYPVGAIWLGLAFGLTYLIVMLGQWALGFIPGTTALTTAPTWAVALVVMVICALFGGIFKSGGD